jgi:hypothetical protein
LGLVSIILQRRDALTPWSAGLSHLIISAIQDGREEKRQRLETSGGLF